MRVAEDEAVAQAAFDRISSVHDWDYLRVNDFSLVDTAHITRWQPARVLAECKAKRRLVRSMAGSVTSTRDWSRSLRPAMYDYTLRLLALPYADHSDYQASWRV